MISAKELQGSAKTLNLLFVEDDKSLRIQMGDILSTLFHNVELAENGQIGLEKYRQKIQQDAKPYDLVITDINMPVMNGIDMIHAIYAISPAQPVLVVSAHNESDYLVQLLHVGVNGFLIKPMQHQTLMNTLYQVTQAIVNERLVISHYEKIEKLNAELSRQRKQLKQNNQELHHKNMALEKSMRIIEGMHHKDQLFRNNNILSTTPGLPSVEKKDIMKERREDIKRPPLEMIEDCIDKIFREYDTHKVEETSFANLSEAVRNYADFLPDESIYQSLASSFHALSRTISEHPKCTRIDDNKRIFNMLESFFFIYNRWEREWSTLETEKFIAFSHSISEEIDVLINVWECKS